MRIQEGAALPNSQPVRVIYNSLPVFNSWLAGKRRTMLSRKVWHVRPPKARALLGARDYRRSILYGC